MSAEQRARLQNILSSFASQSNESNTVDNNGSKEALATGSQSNESNTVDNNGSNEVLPTGSDTRDVTDSGARTQNNNSSDTNKVDHCSSLNQLANAVNELETVPNVKEGADSESHIASNTSSSNVSEVEHSNENPNELGAKQEFETVPQAEENATTATDIAPNTSSNNVSEAKHSNKNPNELDKTKDRLSDQSNADGSDSNQDDEGVHPNTKTNALAKAAALPKNTGSTSATETNLFGTSSESESAAEEDDGPHDVAIPYPVVDGKWEYIMCDINQVKKYAENSFIEVELEIKTCFYRRGQYTGDVLRLRSEFVFVWHFLCYLFNFLCCPF